MLGISNLHKTSSAFPGVYSPVGKAAVRAEKRVSAAVQEERWAHRSGGPKKDDLPSCEITADLMKWREGSQGRTAEKAFIIYHYVRTETLVFTNIELVLISSSHLKVKTVFLL